MINQESIKVAVDTLKQGGVIIHQTDTVPGLAGDATNPASIDKMYEVKARDKNKPMLMLCSDLEMVGQYVSEIPGEVMALYAQEFDSAITFIYPQAIHVAENLPHANGSIGIRIPKHDLSLKLIAGLGRPIASTSANLSGQPTPKSLKNIDTAVLKHVDYILTLPAVELDSDIKPSWILTIKKDKIHVIREGSPEERLTEWLYHQ